MTPTRGERDREYRQYVALLDSIIERAGEHQAAEPDCTAAPFCIGKESMFGLAAMVIDGSIALTDLLYVAVHELSKTRGEAAVAARRLEAQIQVNADLISSGEAGWTI